MPIVRRINWPRSRRIIENEAAPLSVTRTQRLGTAVSQMTVRLPVGAGLRPRKVRSVMSVFNYSLEK